METIKHYLLYKALGTLATLLLLALFVSPWAWWVFIPCFIGTGGLLMELPYALWNASQLEWAVYKKAENDFWLKSPWATSDWELYKQYKAFLTKEEQEQWLRVVLFEQLPQKKHKIDALQLNVERRELNKIGRGVL